MKKQYAMNLKSIQFIKKDRDERVIHQRLER